MYDQKSVIAYRTFSDLHVYSASSHLINFNLLKQTNSCLTSTPTPLPRHGMIMIMSLFLIRPFILVH